MSSICWAYNCSNSYAKGYKMYSFPMEPKRRKEWMENARRQTGNTERKTEALTSQCRPRLCEMHFEPDQFEQNRADGKKKLRPFAVPTIFDFNQQPMEAKRCTPKHIPTVKKHAMKSGTAQRGPCEHSIQMVLHDNFLLSWSLLSSGEFLELPLKNDSHGSLSSLKIQKQDGSIVLQMKGSFSGENRSGEDVMKINIFANGVETEVSSPSKSSSAVCDTSIKKHSDKFELSQTKSGMEVSNDTSSKKPAGTNDLSKTKSVMEILDDLHVQKTAETNHLSEAKLEMEVSDDSHVQKTMETVDLSEAKSLTGVTEDEQNTIALDLGSLGDSDKMQCFYQEDGTILMYVADDTSVTAEDVEKILIKTENGTAMPKLLDGSKIVELTDCDTSSTNIDLKSARSHAIAANPEPDASIINSDCTSSLSDSNDTQAETPKHLELLQVLAIADPKRRCLELNKLVSDVVLPPIPSGLLEGSKEGKKRRRKKSFQVPRPHVCHVCGASLYDKVSFDIHLRVKHGEGPELKKWPCPYCDKTFYKRIRRDTHVKVHEGVMDVVCDICGRAFRCTNNLTRHRHKFHKEAHKYYCDKCGLGADKPSKIRKHVCPKSDTS